MVVKIGDGWGEELGMAGIAINIENRLWYCFLFMLSNPLAIISLLLFGIYAII